MFGNREVAKGIDNHKKINDHISFFLTLFPFTFLLQIGALFFLIPREILSFRVVLIIVFVNFCDYFNQEVYRYLIMVQKIGKANILLVAKSTIFLVLVVVYHFLGNSLDLSATLWLMLISFFLLLLVTFSFLFRFIIQWQYIDVKRLNFEKVKGILRFLFPFILLMIFTKGVESIDKFAIEYFYNSERVGVYSFLFSIASLVYVFVISGFYLVYLPIFIKENEVKNQNLKSEIVKFSILVILSSILISFGIIVFIDYLLDLIGKGEIKDSKRVLYILLGAFFFLNLSQIPGILLYVRGKETKLTAIMAINFFVNLILNLMLLKTFNIEGAAIALLITYIINFVITTYTVKSEWKEMKKNFL